MSPDSSHILGRDEIEQRIPHRGPMLLVDDVVEMSEERIVCRKTFRPDEHFFDGHYPDHPLVPGVILCEASMQAGAILLSQFELTGVPVATRMNDVRFRKMVHPGDTIQMEVQLSERLANAFFMKAKVTRDSDTVMRCEFACTAAAPDGENS